MELKYLKLLVIFYRGMMNFLHYLISRVGRLYLIHLVAIVVFFYEAKAVAETEYVCGQPSLLENDFYFTDLLAEVKVGFFRPNDHTFREIYCSGPSYSAELTACVCNGFAAWGSVGYFYRQGFSMGLQTPTKFNLLPLSMGLKYFYNFDKADFYVGLGAQFTRMHTHDSSPYVIRNISHWNWGGIAKVGCIFNFCDSWFLDLFTDYSWLDIHLKKTNQRAVIRHRANLNGWSVGCGFGWHFFSDK